MSEFELVQPEAPVADKALAWLKFHAEGHAGLNPAFQLGPRNSGFSEAVHMMLREVYGLQIKVNFEFVKV